VRKLRGVMGAAALAIAVAGLYAQHEAPQGHAAESGSAGHGGLEIWKWANFALLAGALGYLVKKNAGPFFAARSGKILEEISEAAEFSRRAAARAAEVEGRLAGLEAEIAALRREAAAEAEAESAGAARQAAAEVARIQENAEQAITAAAKAARLELQRYAAALAVALAETKIRARMTPEAQDALVRGFVEELPGASGAARLM